MGAFHLLRQNVTIISLFLAHAVRIRATATDAKAKRNWPALHLVPSTNDRGYEHRWLLLLANYPEAVESGSGFKNFNARL